MVPTVRMNRWSVPSASVNSTQATMLFLWMSKPQQRGYTTCMPRAPCCGASERCEGTTRFACVLTSEEGQQSSIRERDPHQLPKRAYSTKMPRSHLAGCAPSMRRCSSASLAGTAIMLPNSQKLMNREPKAETLQRAEPLSRFQPAGSGRDHRSLGAALVTWTTPSALERIDWRPFEPPTHSDSGRTEADQRRQAGACLLQVGWKWPARTPAARVGSHPGQAAWA